MKCVEAEEISLHLQNLVWFVLTSTDVNESRKALDKMESALATEEAREAAIKVKEAFTSHQTFCAEMCKAKNSEERLRVLRKAREEREATSGVREGSDSGSEADVLGGPGGTMQHRSKG